MAESTTLERPASDAPNETASDASLEAQLSQLSDPAGEEQAAGDGETPSGEGSQETAPERSPQEDYQDLVARLDAWKTDPANAEPLSTAEKTRLHQYEQSIEDSRRAREQARQLAKDNETKLAALKSNAPQRVLSHLDAELEAADMDGRAVSKSLLTQLVSKEIEDVLTDAEPLALFGWGNKIADHALVVNDTPEIRSMLAGAVSFEDRLNVLMEAVYAKGKTDGPTAQEVTKLKDDLAKANKEIATLKGARGTGSGGTSAGGSTPPGALNRNTVKNLSAEQVAKLMSTPEGFTQLQTALRG